MEGVGARLGRSSTRYGPATVFNGPVRKWKKRWIHVSPSSNTNNHSQSQHHHINTNGSTPQSNGNNGSHLLLYKWTPLIQTNNNNSNGKAANHSNGLKDDAPQDQEQEPVLEPPRRKFKYIPVDLLEKQKIEAAEEVHDEAKLSDTDPTEVETIRRSDGFDEKPDINDVPKEESQFQDDNQAVRQDLNESTLDLSLGLKSHDGDSDSKPDLSRDGQSERVNSASSGSGS